jgi:3-deoxy-D-manno-octulosonic-acid transferase
LHYRKTKTLKLATSKIASSFALAIYGMTVSLLRPLAASHVKRRARQEPVYGEHIAERYGNYTGVPSEGWIWIHAVSLGETKAAAILIRELRHLMPEMRLLLTNGTATGRQAGQEILRSGDHQVWLPWDTPGACRRFFSHFQPRIGIMIETEVWPVLCATARSSHVPLILANARLNSKSEAKALCLSVLSQAAYQSFRYVFAQTPLDAQRLANVGAQQIEVFGNLKFDAYTQPAIQQQGLAWKAKIQSRSSVVMLTSSREGEEKLFLQNVIQCHKKIRSAPSEIRVQWLIVPRHPQRFDEIQSYCEELGLTVSRRTQWHSAPLLADVWLGDSVGEMAAYYSLADIALLGGSFESFGGQNLIEAIAADCPVVMGPHTFNFFEACASAQAHGAACRVQTMQEAVDLALSLIDSPLKLTAMKEQGKKWLNLSQGSAKKMAERIKLLIN